jgi:hypothetical protein
MNFDAYWERLVNRVHRDKEVLHGPEALFYRLSSIRGETSVGGVQTYFDERFREFDADMKALESVGLDRLAALYRRARVLLFGGEPLTEATVFARLDRDDDDEPAELEQIHEELTPRLDELEAVRDALGVSAGLYEPG